MQVFMKLAAAVVTSIVIAFGHVTPVSETKATPTPSETPTPTASSTKRPEVKPSRKRAGGPHSLKDVPKAWRKLAWCESRYTLNAVSPGKKYYGLWQLHKGFYNVYDYNPRTATFEQQWRVAQYVYRRQGAKAWSCASYAGLK